MILLVILVILAALVLFAVWPGAKREDLRAPFYGRNYAHRGYFGKDQRPPENSLPAFAAAAKNGYGIELDVQFTSDKKLVVFHDDTLDRMTPAKGFVHDMPWAEFSALPLAGSEEHPPLFADMLKTVADANPATPLIVEIKSRTEYSKAYLTELVRATLDTLQNYPGPYCLESFDPRVVALVPRMAIRLTANAVPIRWRPMRSRTCSATLWRGRISSPGALPRTTGRCPCASSWAPCLSCGQLCLSTTPKSWRPTTMP